MTEVPREEVDSRTTDGGHREEEEKSHRGEEEGLTIDGDHKRIRDEVGGVEETIETVATSYISGSSAKYFRRFCSRC